ncbi:MAG: SIMPL domain-containing protein [Paracoccaceae bacterium]
MLTRSLPALALAFGLVLPFSAPMLLADPATLTVTGEGVSEVAPDLAMLSIGVTTTGKTAAEALASNSAALAIVLDRLHSAGIEDRDLQTANLSVNPDWSNSKMSSSGVTDITSYTAMNMVTVKIRALDSLGPVLDAAVADGANTLNGLSFGVAEPRPAMDAARGAAVQDARAKGLLLAAALGQELGRLVSVTEGPGYGSAAPMYADAKAAAPVPIQAGELSFAASVTVVWELAE